MGGVSASESLEDDLETTLQRNEFYLPNRTTTFHFVGIRQPQSMQKEQRLHRKSTMFDAVKPSSITSHIQLSDTVSSFKKLIRQKFELPKHREILVLYSNIVLHDWKKSLLDYGVTDQSCFLIALHDDTEKFNKLKVDKQDKKEIKQIDKTLKSMKIESRKSLDVVTQEENVDVFKMNGCAHSMNKESLYQYTLSQYQNKKEKIKCPHTECNKNKQQNNGLCTQEWSYPVIKAYLLSKHANIKEEDEDKYNENKDEIDNKVDQEKKVSDEEAKRLMKLELLLSRNYVENKYNLQKCPECQTLYFRGNKTVTKVKVKCVLCLTDFCWKCNTRYKAGHMCDGAFRDHTLNILKTCPTKVISGKKTPSIRACPKCTQLITHTQGCNHMYDFICMLVGIFMIQ